MLYSFKLLIVPLGELSEAFYLVLDYYLKYDVYG